MRLKTQDTRRWLMASAVVLSMAVAPESSHAVGLAADFCGPGEVPGFHFGFMDLASILGDTIGAPIECEHPDNVSGDTLQGTMTGLVFYRASTNTPTFTDGLTHWALTDTGMVTWTGSAVDPPGISPPASSPPLAANVAATPDVTPLPPPQPPVGVWVSVSEQAVQNNRQSFVTKFVPAPQYPYDNRLFRLA